MKTAKEITKGIVKDSLRKNYDLSIPEIEGQIIDYARQKCKEQRDICCSNFENLFSESIEHPNIMAILNAPEPEFE